MEHIVSFILRRPSPHSSQSSKRTIIERHVARQRPRPKRGPAQTDFEVKYFYNADEKSDYIFVFPPRCKSTSLRDRFGPEPFFGGVSAQRRRQGASTHQILDRLDTFSDAIDLTNTLSTLFLRLGGHKPDISGTGKI